MPKDAASKVAIQGQIGSYHDLAAQKYFGADYQPVACETFEEVFEQLAKGTAGAGIIAIENSLYGSLGPRYDMLGTHDDLTITGEVYLRIRHCLIGLPEGRLQDIRAVHSQHEALGQCQRFLRAQLSQAAIVREHDTTGSVELVAQKHDPTLAAIASAEAASRYRLAVLAEGIEDDPQNYTRFLILQKKDVARPPVAANKTSLLMEHLSNDTDDSRAGELYVALGCFANNGVSLTKIESRPFRGQAWCYQFYIDCAVGLDDPNLQAALTCLRNVGAKWKILGTYQQGDM